MRPLIYAILGFSVLGIIDAGYLSYSRITNSALNCSLLEGCNAVASSPFSTLFSIPLAYLGLAFYLAIFVVSLMLFRKSDTRWIKRLLLLLALGGFLSSLYFVYVQVAIIKEICIYCMISAANATIIFLLSLFLSKKAKTTEPTSPEDVLGAQSES